MKKIVETFFRERDIMKYARVETRRILGRENHFK